VLGFILIRDGKEKWGKKKDKLSFLFNLKEVKTRRRNFKEVIKKRQKF
jgi:hypothetical protein